LISWPSVAIVILNWNGKHFLERFLPSVVASEYENLKIIIADNASTDDSVSFLQRNYPGVTRLNSVTNQGFAKGYNSALKQVSADYYILLNSDVEVNPYWITPVILLMESDDKIAACQPKILSFQNKKLFEYAGACGGWIDALGYPFTRGRIFDNCETDHGQYDSSMQIFWATGAALFVKSKVFHEINGFDEYFFAHQEEIDLCWRMQRAGYTVYVEPKSKVYHVGGGTLPRGNSKKTFLNFRNNQILLAKNLPWSEKWWKIPFRILLDQVSAVKGLLSGDAGYFVAIFKAHIGFFDWVLFKPKKKPEHTLRKLKTFPGVYHGNIVWQHFALKKKSFKEITGTD